MSTIGSRIRARREELNMSQDELGKRLGYKSRSSINKIELDQRNLTQSKIKAIADALDTTPAYIMGWEEAKAKPPKNESISIYDRVANELGQEAAEVLKLFSGMNDPGQQLALSMLQSLACNPSNTEQKKESLGA